MPSWIDFCARARKLVGADAAFLLERQGGSGAFLIASSPTPVQGTVSLRPAQADGTFLGPALPSLIASSLDGAPANILHHALSDGAGDRPEVEVLFIWCQGANAPVHFPDLVDHLRGEWSDLWSLRRTDRQSEINGARLLAIMRALPQAIAFVDAYDPRVLINRQAAEILGLTTGEVAAADFAAALSLLVSRCTDADEMRERARQMLAETEGRMQNWIWRFADGSAFLNVTTVPVIDSLASGRLWVFEDISERERLIADLREARMEAESASEAKSAFLASMSHELRTPLNAVIGYGEAMQYGIGGTLPERHLDYVEMIVRSGRLLLDLINDVLDLSKIEAGKQQLAIETVDLAEIVARAVQTLLPVAEDRGIVIRSQLQTSPLPIAADERATLQVVLNLLSNAVKFARSEVTLSLVWSATTGDLQLDIEDDGHGMTEAQIRWAMEPFQQIEDVPYTSQEGTGLGLPIAARLTALQGGSLRLQHGRSGGTLAIVTFVAAREQRAIRMQ